jgi:hypothetical protein
LPYHQWLRRNLSGTETGGTLGSCYLASPFVISVLSDKQ